MVSRGTTKKSAANASKPATASAAKVKTTAKRKADSKPKPKATKSKTAAKPTVKAKKKAAAKSRAATSPRPASRTRRSALATKVAAEPVSTTRAPAAAPRREIDPRHRELAERLLAKQAELLHAYAASKGDSRDRLDDGTEDYIDYAVNSYAKDFILSLNEIERKQLLLVQDALRRLQTGDYGRCLECEEEIPIRRLEVVPWVRYCVRCQELEDRGELEARPLTEGVQSLDDDSEFDDDYDDEFEDDEDEDDEEDDDEGEEEDDGDEDDAPLVEDDEADLDAEE